ncbi:transporter substrate-binding domain-containing protein [Chitinimonas viridis]|uniref:Transporter substrate-binding domain-containing protein n=1 Tax=Chitinimonas viridis TaxID=664880 RepID=A0ABT8B8U9_9NEIS|nr:transporter substrate-binding domain-containing protein [Chitinimonas viridis]MDN3578475.1 transporter substrate-binding domain-containing protein [Chitinimonas viridis]
MRLVPLLLMLAGLTAQAAETLHIATAEYLGYAEPSGNGYYLDLLRKIYPAPDYQLKISFVPYERARVMLESGSADILPSTSHSQRNKMPLSAQMTDMDVVDAAVQASRFPAWQGKASLAGMRVGAQIGYAFTEYAPDIRMDYQEKTSLSAMLEMLAANRLDVVLDYEAEMKPLLAKQSRQVGIVIKPAVLTKPLYFGFVDKPRGKQLKARFDAELTKLKQSGELKRLFMAYPSNNPNAFPP